MRNRVYLAMLSILVTAATWAAPQPVESFEGTEFRGIQAAGCKAERSQELVSDGEWALKADFPGNENDTWPGLSVTMPGGDTERGELLAFDVFNPMDDAVSLSYRIDRADGTTSFGGETVPVGQWHTLRIWLSSGVEGPARVDRVFPYIRMPRQDYTLYFDHFRIESSTDRFKRIAYVELAGAPEPTEEEQKFGALVFSRTPLAHVFQNSLPWPGERTGSLSFNTLNCVVARGESEPVSLSVHALRTLEGLSLETTALTGEPGTLPDDSVRVGRIRYLDKKTTYSSSEYIAGLPTYVEPKHVFENLPEGTTGTFWITVEAPPDAAAGLYHCDVLLKADGNTIRLPLRVRVLPFALPEAEGHFIGDYYRAYGYKEGEEGIERMREDLADMRGRGMTSVGLCFGLDTEKVVIEEGKVDLGLDGSSRFEQFMDLYRDLDFPMPVIMLSDSGQGVAGRAGEYGSPEHDAAYKAFWQTVQATCKERGWPELIVQPVDEPGWQSQEHRDRNVYYLKLLKQIPGMRTEVDGPGDTYFHEVAGPYADVWNYNGAVAPFDKLAEYKKEHIITIYNNDVEGYRPEVQRYVTGIFQLAAGINGAYNWEYRGGRNDLYNDFDGSSGDWVHNYLPQGDSLGGPSLGWEGARDGVDDLRYFILLDSWLARAREARRDAPAIRYAEELLAYLLESIDAAPAVRGRANWTFSAGKDREGFESSDPAADRFIGGFLKQPNGWTPRDYARSREAVGYAIYNLMLAVETDTMMAGAVLGRGRNLQFLGAVAYPEDPVARTAVQRGQSVTQPVAKLSEAPKIDGHLDEAVWKEAKFVEKFVPISGEGDVSAQTEAWVGWHGESLFVGVRCVEPQMGSIVAQCQEDGEPVYTDDCVEIFLDPALSKSEFAQFAVNAKGVQWARDTKGIPWKERVPVAASLGENEWCVEVALPLKYVLASGPVFGFNVARERRAGGSLELSCWRPTGGQFGVPTRFAALELQEADDVVAGLPVSQAGLLMLREAPALAFPFDVITLDVLWKGEPAVLNGAQVRAELTSAGGVVEPVAFPAPGATRFTAAIRLDYAPVGVAALTLRLIAADGTEAGQVEHTFRVVPAL